MGLIKLKVIQGVKKGKVITLSEFPCILGRDENCNAQLPDSEVSREHLAIHKNNDDFFIEDLNSSNGTTLNGEFLYQSAKLSSNDIIGVTAQVAIRVVELTPEYYTENNSNFKTFLNNYPIKKESEGPRYSSNPADIIRKHIQVEETFILEPTTGTKIDYSHRALKTIYEVIHQCNQEADTEAFLVKLIRSISQLVESHRGALILKKRNSDDYEGKAYVCGEDLIKKKFHVPSVIMKDIIENGVSIISYKPLEDVQFHESKSLRIAKVRSLICAPLTSKDKAFGAIYFDRITFKSKPFHKRDLELIAAIGIQVGAMIEKSLLLEDLQKVHKKLEMAQEQVIKQERLSALGQLASGIVHDFNNALSSILGYSELLMLKPGYASQDPEIKEFIDTIMTSAKDAANIVARLREFYRKREENEVFTKLDINNLITQSINMTVPKWKVEAQSKGINIKVVKKFGNIPRMNGNEVELREVFVNLIINAVDAMPKGGTITISTEREGNHVLIKIKDDGTGMSEKIQRQCLEPFFTTKGDQGSGMGLAEVFGIIVQRHEGSIDIQSQENKGTIFLIRVPLKINQLNITKKDKKLKKYKSLHILIIDDNPTVLSTLCELLKKDSHIIQTASNGYDGLEKFYSDNFDVVITNMAMPEMNGEELAKAIKVTHPNFPIIMLTGFADVMRDNQPKEIDYLVSKPFTFGKIQEALAAVLENSFIACNE